MSELRFDGKVVVVTGAGGGLGKAYALFFGKRGASVVVNDLGGSFKGEGASSKAADVVVEEIVKNGGKAVANYDSVENGDKIIETAVKAFGTVHIVINNAGILRDVSFKNLTDKDWDLIYRVHVYGAYKVTKAAWPHFRKQKFGRIINTASAAGLYGNFGQANYSAAKLALVGFTETLAKEGQKYNITANVIAPLAASRLTETIMPPEILKKLSPERVVPLVAYLTHESTTETYGIYELGAGFFSKLRWERGSGHVFKADSTFTPSAILKEWNDVVDFSNPEYPNGPADFISLAEQSQKKGPNAQGEPVDLKDQVVIVTGAGAGIGRAYALLLAKLGAKVVVNDFVNPDNVVEEIKKAGGIAVGDKSNVVDGAHVVKTALDAFGTVHAVVNNAGILRDKSFQGITDEQWQQVIDVHLNGTYAVTKAVWPIFLKQKYGRIINTTSTSGIYGNFGQSNYSAAKLGILGFSRTLAIEGKKSNIFVNTIAPNAGTAMTKGIFTDEMLEMFKPEQIAPLVSLLASQKAPITGGLFEVGSGWVGATRWQRSSGVTLHGDVTPEQIAANWEKIVDFDNGKATHPSSTQESSASIMQAITEASSEETETKEPNLDLVDKADLTYTFKDSILYNLTVGAKAEELKYTFEGSEDFELLPTFGVIPFFSTSIPFEKLVPNFNPMKLLHGEQYLEIRKWPIPTEGTLETTLRPLEVVDKGKAAIVISETTTVDKNTREEIFYNVSSMFIRGSGGYGGHSKAKDRGAITAANKPPARAPDFTSSYHVSEDLAAYYRLNGDLNPLHIDPAFAAVGNFPKPILHGLASFGISGKILYDKYGPYKNIKVRFAGHVFPGETLKVEAWKEGSKVIFQTKVVERNTIAIAAAAIELLPKGAKL
ncbi:hypothetical protein DV495_002365 [Geotrichum candidum]|uniref:Peroxisomal hydratase-dehydrogenase-epimerase n=1 Tax=Geotrichum candidum TaxID=1173061 RepID=A0A0J9XH79_GEOCN|nr:hypothetical protein DV454_004883 [Geotrichum candidum]KAI9210673.1 hypothetical protein DS838_004445 [Geotrichum bryndzae]KAF5112447.1 hypothetical protein DV452_004037 [Geotrichum candidum]KAF5129331.1 hypothetical protein DV495_002365 [Geotrichum candidum]KAF7498492.1 hypothetical protein DV113_003486 [Geotrichum candidum]